MTFTTDEEANLRLMLNEFVARQKLNKVNQAMGDAIRAQFSSIDATIRAQYKEQIDALNAALIASQTAIKDTLK